MVLHHVKLVDIERLEEIFAVLTPEGWKIPDWLVLLRQNCKELKMFVVSAIYTDRGRDTYIPIQAIGETLEAAVSKFADAMVQFVQRRYEGFSEEELAELDNDIMSKFEIDGEAWVSNDPPELPLTDKTEADRRNEIEKQLNRYLEAHFDCFTADIYKHE